MKDFEIGFIRYSAISLIILLLEYLASDSFLSDTIMGELREHQITIIVLMFILLFNPFVCLAGILYVYIAQSKGEVVSHTMVILTIALSVTTYSIWFPLGRFG